MELDGRCRAANDLRGVDDYMGGVYLLVGGTMISPISLGPLQRDGAFDMRRVYLHGHGARYAVIYRDIDGMWSASGDLMRVLRVEIKPCSSLVQMMMQIGAALCLTPRP